MINRLAFYDFDGTLANTPIPDTGKLVWKQKTGQVYPHQGWWGRPESLSLNVFDIKVFPSIAEKLKKDMARQDTYVAILTSRVPKLEPYLKAILDKNNINVNEISTKKGGKSKDIRIKEFLQRFPDVKEIDVYDDRKKEFDVLLPLKKELADVVNVNIYAVDNGSIRLLESFDSIKTLINEEIQIFLNENEIIQYNDGQIKYIKQMLNHVNWKKSPFIKKLVGSALNTGKLTKKQHEHLFYFLKNNKSMYDAGILSTKN